MRTISFILFSLGFAWGTRQPNVVLVISDDQGYGDLGFTGNPVVQTPHINHLIKESVWLEDYHVAPTCSPTRCSLLTGRWTDKTGVWHTINGRSMLRENEITLADYLKGAGYKTGIFGKWHLGGSFPYRPEDRGFTYTYYHGAGGVGQTPDVWNNDYFNDQYFHNGKVVQAEGYCTDVFFDEASKFITKSAEAGNPFFAYISTNAPHVPLSVPEEYMERYKGKEGVTDDLAAFYGMITNIDDNVGRLRDLLVSLEIDNDTIFIFTTDNGSASGTKFFNAGMQGKKGSEYDGGHRVPFALHWPYYGLDSHKVVKPLTHMVDIVPTLIDFCEVELEPREWERFDGYSLEPLVGDKETSDSPERNWERRITFTDSQRVVNPVKWKQTSVMSGKWRLVNGEELYNVKYDPGQKTNMIKDFPDEAERMEKWYDKEWDKMLPTFSETTELYLGHEKAPITMLNAHDWIQEELPPWNQQHIRAAQGFKKDAEFKGYWAVKVVNSGEYKISVSRWPVDSGISITKSIEAMPKVSGSGKNYSATIGKAIPIKSAVLRIDGKEIETLSVSDTDKVITFITTLKKGSHTLSPYFTFENEEKGKGQIGTYFCKVEKL